jgi:hypothetical protein
MTANAPVVITKVTANPAFGAELTVAWGGDRLVGTREADEFVGDNVFKVPKVVIAGDKVLEYPSTY